MNTSWEFYLEEPWWVPYYPSGAICFTGKKKPKDDKTEVDNKEYIFAISGNTLNDCLKNKAGGIETTFKIKTNHPEKKEEFEIFMRHKIHIEEVAERHASEVEPEPNKPHYFITSEIYTDLATNI